MFGGLTKTTSRLAIAAAAGMLMGGMSVPAKAADLGGDCCADLEERVAELEATTVRKGNRKVSVTLYGWVNQGVMWYDNGEESDVYVGDNAHAMTRFGIKGSGKVRPGAEISYRIEIGASRESSFLISENDNDDGTFFGIRQAWWGYKDDNLGTITVGHQYPGSAGTGATEVGGAGGWEDYNHGATDGLGFGFNIYDATAAAYTSTSWFAVLPNLDPGRLSVVKYTSPEFAGFTASASWGEDDRWDVGLTYAKDWNGVYVAAGVGYFEDTDNGDGNVYSGVNSDVEKVWSASLGIYHAASGLYGEAGYFKYDDDLGGVSLIDASSWYGKIGIRKNWSGMGETDIYAQWQHAEDFVALNTDADMYGVGIGQDIDAVGATAYLSWKHYETDLSVLGTDAADLDTVTAGMIVPF